MRIIFYSLLLLFISLLYPSCDAIRRSMLEDKFEVIEDLSAHDAIKDYGLMSGSIDLSRPTGGDTSLSFKVIRNPYLDMNMSVIADWEFKRDVHTPIALSFTDPFEGWFYGNIYEKSFASFDMNELKEHVEGTMGFTNAYSQLDTMTTRRLFPSSPSPYYRMFASRIKDQSKTTSIAYLLENESHMFSFSYYIEGAVDTGTVDRILSVMVNSATMNGHRIFQKD